jgi:hypothetical protein
MDKIAKTAAREGVSETALTRSIAAFRVAQCAGKTLEIAEREAAAAARLLLDERPSERVARVARAYVADLPRKGLCPAFR